MKKEIRHFRIPGTKGPTNGKNPHYCYSTACGRNLPANMTATVWPMVTCKQCRARKHI